MLLYTILYPYKLVPNPLTQTQTPENQSPLWLKIDLVQYATEGNSGRVVVWKIDLISVTEIAVSNQEIHCMVQVADSLEKGTEHEDEYMISEKELLVNRFISIPKDMGAFNCGAFVAGIVRGVLENAGFPAVGTSHFVPVEGQQRPRRTILIKFAEEVVTLYVIFQFNYSSWLLS
ncbi:hypothetical protein K7X08_028683 [Anisodus acutangulus]|uniref:Uncharacterized protein n=1 Tax=Anisodus acutangulus TaxID=402998 RepID=A0A9Q1QTZ1_9SOLA|nr:hypothetical protein K7X08_028683 [Anisodus acutangulus]